MSSWNRAVSRFARGQCALLIAYSNYTRYLADEPLCAVSGQVGYAPSPSGKAFRGGGMIGVMKNSPHIEECALFLDWLYSPGISQLLALLSGCSPLSSAYDCAEITDLYPWLDTVKAGLLGGARRQLIPTLQAPLDRMHVEEEIAVICNRAVRGERTVQETLDDIFRLGF
jgi:ABC-type glycerol-3-phosphate transport system substrate-binding protein